LKSEIDRQKPDVKQDVYGDHRDKFPGGMPGRVASTFRRSDSVADENGGPGITMPPAGEPQPGDRDYVESPQQQALHKVEMGKLDANKK
jgi:hypothetical protein